MNRRCYSCRNRILGSALLEAIIAILLFSIGVTGALLLLGTAVQENSAAQYRGQAAMLIDSVIADMWTGERSQAGLLARFASTASGFKNWKDRVAASLPGSAAKPPEIDVGADGTVTVRLYWRASGEGTFHQLVTVTRIGD